MDTNANTLRQKTFLIMTWLLIWIVAAGAGVYFRMYPLRTFATHEAREKASLLVVNNMRAKIARMIQTGFPHLPEAQQAKMIRDEVNQTLHDDADEIRQGIQDLAQKIDRETPGSRTYPFLLGSDSYYYYRLTEKILKTGTISSAFKGSKYYNELMLAPEGHWEPLNLHPYLGAGIYRFLAWLNPKRPLMEAVSWTPLVVMALALIPFLIICRQLQCHPVVALVGAATFVLAPIFLKRSTFGWYDNDPYNTLFPLAIMAALFYGLRHRARMSIRLRGAVLGVILLALYTLFWHGWMFLLSVILLSGIIMTILSAIVSSKIAGCPSSANPDGTSTHSNHCALSPPVPIIEIVVFFATLAAGMMLAVSMIFGFEEFFILFKEGWRALNDFIKPQLSFWPNLYIGVGELHGSSLRETIASTGGVSVYAFAAAGLIGSLFSFARGKSQQRLNPFIVIVVFAFAAFAMATQAKRFVLLSLIPLSLLFTLGLQLLLEYIRYLARVKFSGRLPRAGLHGATALLMAGLLIVPVRTAHTKLPELLNIIYNDTWQTLLTKLKEKTPPESIINAWWPPGHFITAVAQRRVTIDGASINKPQAYWLARVWMSQTEREGLGLLRMLNTSGNEAVAYLQSCGYPLSESVRLLDDITALGRTQARKKLASLLKPEQITHLIELTHQTPPPSYLMIYNELVDKNIQLGFIANWDFRMIQEAAHSPLLRREFTSGAEAYVRQVWKMGGGMPKYSGLLHPIGQSGTTLVFDRGLNIDLTDMTCQIVSDQYGHGIPLSLFYAKDGQIIEKKFAKASLPYSVVLSVFNNKPVSALMDRRLARTLIMRLYFFKGAGMRYIHPFVKQSDLTGRTQIEVFAVDWQKFQQETATTGP